MSTIRPFCEMDKNRPLWVELSYVGVQNEKSLYFDHVTTKIFFHIWLYGITYTAIFTEEINFVKLMGGNSQNSRKFLKEIEKFGKNH